jgi:glutamine synthetase
MHTNFSSASTRDPKTGMATIEGAMRRLAQKHSDHIAVYGYGLEERLTGLHETAHISQFKFGTADRGCSIRIPRHVANTGYGYFEDRRPGANADPYQVASRLIQTVCEIA